ncbi:MAG: AzlD domain-containing protein [Kiloniellales bacterium]|nr:AzlD domain-containing protein [Kiloniellales bacterium]
MTLEPLHLAVIAGMAVVTYASRLGGFLLLAGVEPGPRLSRILSQIPGATFAALIAPMVVQGGPVEWAGAGITVLAYRLFGQVLAAVLCGVLAVALARLMIA